MLLIKSWMVSLIVSLTLLVPCAYAEGGSAKDSTAEQSKTKKKEPAKPKQNKGAPKPQQKKASGNKTAPKPQQKKASGNKAAAPKPQQKKVSGNKTDSKPKQKKSTDNKPNPKPKPKKQTAKGKPASQKKAKVIQEVIKQTVPFVVNKEPVFYPQCRAEPLELGKENFQKNHLALAGLKGFYVNIDDVIKGAKGKNVKLRKGLKKEVIRRLNKVGMRLLTKEEMEATLGQPEMGMFASLPKHLGPFKPGEPRIKYRPDCCTAGIWTSFTQAATTLRHPLMNHKMGTWGVGHNTNDCSDLGKWLSDVVLETVDTFIADKQKGDTDYTTFLAEGGKEAEVKKPEVKVAGAKGPKAKKVKEVAEAKKVVEIVKLVEKVQPVEIRTVTDTRVLGCDTALLLYAEIFPTNSFTISYAKSGVLLKIAENMKACPNYRYRVETHADQRASAEYNEVLSARRAMSILDFLLGQGVREEQFEVRFYGERRPLVIGDSEAAHAANRRVTITPIKANP